MFHVINSQGTSLLHERIVLPNQPAPSLKVDLKFPQKFVLSIVGRKFENKCDVLVKMNKEVWLDQ